MARKKIKTATDQRPFTIVYDDFLESSLLDKNEKLVFICIKRFTNFSTSQSFPSLRTLAKMSGLSVNWVKKAIEHMEEIGVIKVEHRVDPDKGNISNLYTIYDYAEVWNVGTEEKKVVTLVEEISEAKMVAELRARGYVVNKEKELDNATPTKVIAESSSPNQLNQLYIDNNILNTNNSQVRYELEDIKDIFEYDVLIHDYTDQKKEIDSVMDILYDILNTSKKTIRVSGEDKPTMVVVSRLMKLGYAEIMYCIRKFVEQKNEIKNTKSYMITLLYNAKSDMILEINNKLKM